MNYLLNLFIITNWANLKYWFFKILALVTVWFAPAAATAYFLLLLISIDTVTGIIKSKNAGEDFSFKKLLVPFMKKFSGYAFFLITAHAFQVDFLMNDFHLFKWLMYIPVVTEITSISSNIEAYTGIKIATKVKEILNSVLSKAGSKSGVE